MAHSSRFRRELWRKLFHASGLLIVFLYSIVLVNFGQRAALLTLTALLLVLLEIEYVRLEYELRLPGLVEKLLRRHEKDRVTGTIWIVVACIISFSVFDFPIAFLSFFFVIFGDMFASIFGILFGGMKLFRGKTLVGFLAGLSVNILSGAFLLGSEPLVFLSMAVTASVVELLTSKLDDNFTVPLFSGFVGQAVVYVQQFLG